MTHTHAANNGGMHTHEQRANLRYASVTHGLLNFQPKANLFKVADVLFPIVTAKLLHKYHVCNNGHL